MYCSSGISGSSFALKIYSNEQTNIKPADNFPLFNTLYNLKYGGKNVKMRLRTTM